MNNFTIIKTKTNKEETGVTINTYGITNGVICIKDISPNKKIIKDFIEKINRVGVVNDKEQLLYHIDDEIFCINK